MRDSKNRGWEFLTSKDFDGNDDDGSWGTKNSDGSASYYGADGSWGTINSDGSGSYYGADGSWGTKNSDGSSSFYGADGSSEYKDANDEDDDDSYSSADSSDGGSLLGAAIGLGIVGVVAAVAGRKNRSSSSSYEENDDDEDDESEDSYDASSEREYQRQEELERYAAVQQRQEKARIKKEKKKAFRKKHWIGILITILLIIAALFGGYKYWEYSKLIPVGVAAENLVDMDCESVVEILKKSGFTNIHTFPLYDLEYKNRGNDGLTDQVSIADNQFFDVEDKYAYDSRIVIEYHSISRNTVPISAKQAKGEQYQDIVEQFENAGFGNIVVSVDYDLITGWINGVGEVESVSINGDTTFEQGSTFAVDAKIEIVYHDFKKNNPNK